MVVTHFEVYNNQGDVISKHYFDKHDYQGFMYNLALKSARQSILDYEKLTNKPSYGRLK